MESIEEYRNKVRLAARVRDGVPIYNASIEHARVVVETIFQNAEGEMKILSGSLNPQVYGGYDVVSAALGYVRKAGTNMKVLVEEHNRIVYQDNPFVHLLCLSEHVEFRCVSAELRETYKFHFMVAGCDIYRFEQDRESPVAIAAFGHKVSGNVLCDVFGDIWYKAKEFQPIPGFVGG